MPTTSPGLFVGWRLEHGMRCRHTLLVLDYESAREGNFSNRTVVNIPEKEVYFPDAITFPFAEAQQEALDKLKDVAELPDAPACDLPFKKKRLTRQPCCLNRLFPLQFQDSRSHIIVS